MLFNDDSLGLIADIGGTNARFALINSQGEIFDAKTIATKDFSGLAAAAQHYFDMVKPDTKPKRGAFAVASPILGDFVDMTNNHWDFSIREVQRLLELDHLDVVNDFVAQALAVPCLDDDHLIPCGGEKAVKGAPIGVIGPGTGLGVSYLVPDGEHWKAIPTEGGHVTIAPRTDEEWEVIRILQKSDTHISAEKLISGFGLVALYNALVVINNSSSPLIEDAAVISKKAVEGDEMCKKALNMMFAFLGTTAGNLALTTGASGGIYIAGGIVPRKGNLELFLESDFRKRFEDKGRKAGELAPIPSYVIKHDYPAFLGLGALVNPSLKKGQIKLV